MWRYWGSLTGTSAQNEDNVSFADAQGVTPLIGPAALADAAAAYARMRSGAARFRMVFII